LSSPLAIAFLRAGYLLPAFAFFAPDLVVPDFLEPDVDPPRERDLDLLLELEDLLLEPDFDLLEPAFDLLGLDFDLLLEREPDFEPESVSVGGFGGRATGSMCLFRPVLARSGGGSPWALKIPITSGAAPCPEAR
jgi:hypothetical protein